MRHLRAHNTRCDADTGDSVPGSRFERMLDAGCGNGKSTRIFAPYFNDIIGFDISSEQIEKAKEVGDPSHISYVTAPGEAMPAGDCSADLITSAFAVHDMDLGIFLSECKRVLKPNGLVALYGFSPAGLTLSGTAASDDKRGTDVYDKYYWTPLLRYLERTNHSQRYAVDRYQHIYEAITGMEKWRDDSVEMVSSQSLTELKNWHDSVPVFNKYHEDSSPIDRLGDLGQNLKRAWSLQDAKDDEIMVDLTLSVYIVLLTKKHD